MAIPVPIRLLNVSAASCGAAKRSLEAQRPFERVRAIAVASQVAAVGVERLCNLIDECLKFLSGAQSTETSGVSPK